MAKVPTARTANRIALRAASRQSEWFLEVDVITLLGLGNVGREIPRTNILCNIAIHGVTSGAGSGDVRR